MFIFLKRNILIAILIILIIFSVLVSNHLYENNNQWWSNLFLNLASGIFVTSLLIIILNIRRYFRRKEKDELDDYEWCLNNYDEALVVGFGRFREAVENNSSYWIRSMFGYFFEKYEDFIFSCEHDFPKNKYIQNSGNNFVKQFKQEKEKIDELFLIASEQEKNSGKISSEIIEEMNEFIL